MKNNVFMKSISRQLLRSLLLTLLIGIVSFATVTRLVEFVAIRGEIAALAPYHQPIGFLSHNVPGGSDLIQSGVDFLSQSPFINFYQTLAGLPGIIQDEGLQNTLFDGSPKWYEPYHFELHNFDDAVFYGVLEDIRLEFVEYYFVHRPSPTILYTVFDTYYIKLTVRVDYIVAGKRPFQINDGAVITMLYRVDENTELRNTPFAEMEIGGRYLLTGTYRSFHLWGTAGIFARHNRNNPSVFYLRALNSQGDYFWPVESGEFADPVAPELRELFAEAEMIDINQRMLHVIPTIDMRAMTDTQPNAYRYFLVEGRWLTMDDYLNARPIAIIRHDFASDRRLTIGDTITLELQHTSLAYANTTHWRNFLFMIPRGYENWRDYVYGTYTIEVEIVGIYGIYWISRQRSTMAMNSLQSIDSQNIFVPQSAIPSDFLGMMDANFRRYNFVLNSASDKADFMLAYSDALAIMGYSVHFADNGAEGFWIAAYAILQSTLINVLLFGVALVMVIALAGFIYSRWCGRNFAISRALGISAKKAVIQGFVPAVITWLPAVVVGSVLAWGFALAQVDDALGRLLEFDLDTGYYVYTSVELFIGWLIGIVFVISSLSLLVVLASLLRLSRRPVLELLQDTISKRDKNAMASARVVTDEAIFDGSNTRSVSKVNKTHSTPEHVFNKSSIQVILQVIFSRLRYIARSIIRSPIKTALVTMFAVFFVLSLSWLQETIVRTEYEIERLYLTTEVSVSLHNAIPGGFINIAPMNEIIRQFAVDTVMNTGFVASYYLESGLPWNTIIPANLDGSFPESIWEREIWPIRDMYTAVNRHHYAFDWLIAASCLDEFIYESLSPFFNPRGGAIFHMDGFTVSAYNALDYIFNHQLLTFAPGFNMESFVYNENAPIPIIVYENVMARRGLELGDMVFLAEHAGNLGPWAFSAQVIGMYSGHPRGAGFLSTSLNTNISFIPLEAMTSISRFIGDGNLVDRAFRMGTDYMTARFNIDPTRNRELAAMVEEISVPLATLAAGHMHLEVRVDDHILRSMVQPMERNLDLLRILYPIALGAALILASGLSLLLMLQNAKIAAILRTLGAGKSETRIMLCIEQLIVCIAGIALGMAIMPIFGISYGIMLALLVGLYLSGAVIGAVAGSVVISRRPPLELLQVKE